MRNRIFFFGFSIILIVAIAFARGWNGRGDAPAQTQEHSKIIKFSHKKHIVDNGVDCASCHTSADTSVTSKDDLLPTHTECSTCHEDAVNNNCTYCHVSEETEVALEKMPGEVHFNHKIHISGQKLECTTCHAGLDKVDYASEANMPKMATCSACHNDVKASKECATCHINLQTLRPVSHTVGNFLKEHGFAARASSPDAQCRSCHTEASCAQCHDASNITTLSGGSKTGMISPRMLGNDKPEALAGQDVHDINYLFTHGIDAKGKALECQRCHHEQEFCNDCHANGSAALGGPMPVSHEAPDFVTIGYGSGGGEHARLARRDIESCESCHDAEGNDPTCMKCHTDPDGVKHTDPKTHAAGFMSGVHGDWHDNAGATCFACHTDPNAKPVSMGGVAGQGFCGYCHGKK
ncbi:MAG: cytochrome C [Bacteroidota bacterium]|nr:cytochrome C [Bacteroidota bacterium]